MIIERLQLEKFINKDTFLELLQICTPRKFTSKSTHFDMGYEQAKADMLEVLIRKASTEHKITLSELKTTLGKSYD